MILRKWPHPLMHDEGFTLGTFGDLTKNMLCPRAFSLIPAAVNIALAQTNGGLFVTALSLICDLMEASQTTELPPGLVEKKNILEAKALLFSDNEGIEIYWRGIKEWYRLDVC